MDHPSDIAIAEHDEIPCDAIDIILVLAARRMTPISSV